MEQTKDWLAMLVVDLVYLPYDRFEELPFLMNLSKPFSQENVSFLVDMSRHEELTLLWQLDIGLISDVVRTRGGMPDVGCSPL